ncbi:MAG: hypothetical protein ACI8XO_004928, partial [Verrucomicrobiales bacterium]
MQLIRTTILAAASALALTAICGAESFYKEPDALFSTRPSETKSLQSIDRFGPVGMGIELLQPAFTMRIKNIEEGSPAAATGKLKMGQIIETLNGQPLADIDPRMQLGQILAAAEASDGVIKFAIKGEAEPVTVKVSVLGSYSNTWPLDCPKSDKIVRQVADYLSKPGSTQGLGGIGMLFLLSTGEDQDLEVVRNWARKAPAHKYPWYLGYGGIPLTECYLRTGDPEILANIQRWVDNAVKSQHNDAWAGRGSALTTYGQGHLNASGTCVVTFLLLAKECGADVPDHALHGALRHFYRYAGRGGNPYGDDRPEVGFVDNGKNGKLAFAMAAAAALTPDGENSVYARARDACAMQSFYTTSFMLHGHTGGGIGEIWRSAAMGLLHDKKPKQYRDFMDSRQWHYDLSRRFDGSFGILGGSGYDKELWGIAYPLTYTIPRKTLRITGAPRSQFSKPYQLPKQPWGVEADNPFLSLEAVPDKDGKKPDLSDETLAEDSSLPFFRWFHGKDQPSDDDIRRYIHHQDHNLRFVAAFKALGIDSGYIGWRKPGGKLRPHLVMEFLQSNDPRVRRAMFAAIAKAGHHTPEIFQLSVKAVKNPDESWWVKDAAMQILGSGSADQLVPLVDLLLPFLKHEEAWLRNSALTALTPVAADDRCYEKVLPAIGDLIRTNQRVSVTRGLATSIRAKVKVASPAVQQLATETLKETYTGYAGSRTAPGGLNTTSTYDFHLEAIAASLAEVPGGLDALYVIARERHPDEILPYKQYFLNADPSQFGTDLKTAIKPIIKDELIPEFVGKNRKTLRALAAAEVQSERPGGSRDAIDGLAALYARAGQGEFGWKMFADLRDARWGYHTFDPIPAEQVPFDQLITRYRKVTVPKDMEEWFQPDFGSTDEQAHAVWKSSKSPFGNDDGKLPVRPITKCSAGCVGPGCYGATKVNTLWEKEVLLLRGSFKIPPIKDGHRYRLRINDGDHVGAGGGHIVYINGKPLIETKQGGGRGSGGLPKGAYITTEFLDDFKTGEVHIAVMTFIRYNDKYKVKPSSRTPQGKFSLHFEEQKLPPIGDEFVRKSAAVVPMLSSEWQAKQDPENNEQLPDDHKFRWDGKFVANPSMLGDWKLIAEVAEIAEFDPEQKKPTRARNPLFSKLSVRDGGATTDPTWVWSGDHLMDLNKYQALQMQVKTMGDGDYLFVESGGFSTRNKPDWRPKWYVLENISADKHAAVTKPVKVFLLSGQSNMTGRGSLGDLNKPTADQDATLAQFIKKPENVENFKFLYSGANKTVNYSGPKKIATGWTIRDDVFITMGDWPHLKPGAEGYDAYKKHGGLSPYYGGRGNRGFGPELAIGHALADVYDEPDLLV